MNRDLVAQSERALLGSIMLDNSQWSHTVDLSGSDFSLSSHTLIFGCMAAMFEDQKPVDNLSLAQELDRIGKLQSVGDYAYLATLLSEGTTVVDVAGLARYVRESSTEKQFHNGLHLLGKTTSTQARSEILSQLQDMNNGRPSQGWQQLFHSYDDVINAPPARFAIGGFLQEEGITFIGALAGHGKTLTMLAMVRALLEGGKLFSHFPVISKAERVIYLIPEASLGLFSSRLKIFHLQEHIQAGRLFVRTLSAQGQLNLTDSRLLEAAKGADIFLDTAIRFMSGDENNASEQKVFAESLFALQQAGARTITGAHHSPKSFGKDNFMTLENVLRGSGDIGAMLATCWGLSQIDATSNRIFVQNVKARDFSACESFIIQGRPSLDQTGYFELTNPPGFAGTLGDNKPHAGRPEMPQKDEKRVEARRLHDEGKSIREISRELRIGKTTVSRWLDAG